jgi:hypothetical protein
MFSIKSVKPDMSHGVLAALLGRIKQVLMYLSGHKIM